MDELLLNRPRLECIRLELDKASMDRYELGKELKVVYAIANATEMKKIERAQSPRRRKGVSALMM